MEIKKFNEFNNINEGFIENLKTVWDKVVRFFSSEGKNVMRDFKSSEDKEEKKKIINDHIENLAEKYIKEVKKEDEGIFYITELSLEIFKFLDIYKKLTGKKHPRDTWREEFLGGHFVWKELMKIKDPKKLDEYFKSKIDKLKSNQKEELEDLKDEYDRFKSMLSEIK